MAVLVPKVFWHHEQGLLFFQASGQKLSGNELMLEHSERSIVWLLGSGGGREVGGGAGLGGWRPSNLCRAP